MSWLLFHFLVPSHEWIRLAAQVEYGDEEEEQRSLVLHVDDSEVTLNFCLGKDFEGPSSLPPSPDAHTCSTHTHMYCTFMYVYVCM